LDLHALKSDPVIIIFPGPESAAVAAVAANPGGRVAQAVATTDIH